MDMDMSKLKRLFSRLKGIKELVSVEDNTGKEVGDDYNSIVRNISAITGEDLNSFMLPEKYYYGNIRGGFRCQSSTIKNKLLQLIPFLESGYNLSEQIIQIGSIYNSIEDEELKNRCSDILSASGNFDRVINQSTQVLEDRIRNKANADKSLVGVGLVNKVLNSDLSKTIIIASGNPEEHEGVCHICRGLMVGFRNPSHHQLTDSFSRETALKFCAFVDNILQIIGKAKINKDST